MVCCLLITDLVWSVGEATADAPPIGARILTSDATCRSDAKETLRLRRPLEEGVEVATLGRCRALLRPPVLMAEVARRPRGDEAAKLALRPLEKEGEAAATPPVRLLYFSISFTIACPEARRADTRPVFLRARLVRRLSTEAMTVASSSIFQRAAAAALQL